jgi:4'-phosphopantetheinyl transferase
VTEGTGWLVASERQVPATNGWLSASERAVLAGLRFEARRRDWRLGRWVAKCALAEILGATAPVEVRAATDGAPEAVLDGEPAPVGISISHRAGLAACLVFGPAVAAGCDLELVEPRTAALASDYFTLAEQAWLTRADPAGRDLAVALVWSAKESALKALRQGLRLDTRDVEVTPDLDAAEVAGWRAFTVRYGRRRFDGHWRLLGSYLLTVVADPGAFGPAREGPYGRCPAGPTPIGSCR